MRQYRKIKKLMPSYNGVTGVSGQSMPAGGAVTVLQTTNFIQASGAGDKAYNFIPLLKQISSGRIYCAFWTHDDDEAASGSYARMSYSDDNGDNWTLMTDTVATYGDMLPAESDGYFVVGDKFLEIDNKLYLFTLIYERLPGEITVIGAVVNEVSGDSLGESVRVAPAGALTVGAGYTVPDFDAQMSEKVVRALGHGYSTLGKDRLDIYPWETNGVLDVGGTLYESAETDVASDSNGGYISYGRKVPSDSGEEYLTFSNSQDGVVWSPWLLTEIPASPSKIALVKLSDRYMLVWNPWDSGSSLYVGYSVDGLNWDGANIYKIETVGLTVRQYEGSGKAGNMRYASAIELANGQILCAYGKRGKEEIQCSRWALPAMS